MSGHTALVLGDQLMRDNPALEGAARVVFVESLGGLRRVRTHRRRAHLVLSGMRHFAAELRAAGDVEVVEHRGVATLGEALAAERDVVCAEPNVAGARRGLQRLGVRLVPSNQFLTAPEAFADWAGSRRRVVMEDFYREQRRRFGVLLTEDGRPEGGRWNFDRENRRPPARELHAPEPWRPAEDAIDEELRADLDRLDVDLFGHDGPRQFAVTPAEARLALEDFVEHRLAGFGPWQDAMVPGERNLFHALLSVPFNLGVLPPLDAVRAAEAAYRTGCAPLQSVEGFIRQVIGWREYVWGIYWLRVDSWRTDNALDAQRPLPDAFWTGETDANCLRTVVSDVRERAYAHHIQRLMVLNNFALIAGISPQEIEAWFHAAFIDAYDWVMQTNVIGMSQLADGGILASKPYAASANYINKMSDYCSSCAYKHQERTGERACPFNFFYWDFIDRHRDQLKSQGRMSFVLGHLERISTEKLKKIRQEAAI